MQKKIYKILLATSLFLPIVALAEFTKTKTLLESVQNIITKTLIPLVFALGLLLFFWGIVKYIWSEGQGKDEGKKFMLWGVIALFVMASIWGIVYFLRAEIGIGDETNAPIPTIGGSPGPTGKAGDGFTDPIKP